MTVSAPRDGTVVRWRLKEASATPGYSLDVLRHKSNGSYTVTASTGDLTPSGEELQTLATNLPIHKGEYLELNVPQQGELAALQGESTYATFFPTLLSEETREPTNEYEYPFTFAFNADVELDPAPPPAPPDPPADSGSGSAPPVATPPGPTVATPAPIAAAVPVARCFVPKLGGKRLKAAKKKIRSAGCRVGAITKKAGVTARTGKVVHQGRKSGSSLTAGSKVSVRLG